MYPRALIYTDHPLTRCDLYSSRCERLITTGKHSCTVEQLLWNTEKIEKRRCVSNNSVTLVGCDRSRSRSVIDPSARWCCIGLWRDRIITSYHSYHWGFYCYHWGYQRNHYNTNHHFIASRLLHLVPSSEEYNKISFWFIFLCKSLEKPPTS